MQLGTGPDLVGWDKTAQAGLQMEAVSSESVAALEAHRDEEEPNYPTLAERPMVLVSDKTPVVAGGVAVVGLLDVWRTWNWAAAY